MPMGAPDLPGSPDPADGVTSLLYALSLSRVLFCFRALAKTNTPASPMWLPIGGGCYGVR